MNTSESADELVKIYLEGVETVLRISGTGAKNIAMALIAMSKERTQTKGKTRLTNMLKSGKSLDIFTIKAEDLKKFSQEAKKYGILYCALANKRNNKIDGMVDIMVREEEKSKQDKVNINIEEKPKSEEEQFIDDIMPKDKEKQKDIPSNNTKETEKKNLSEISSDTKSEDKVENFKDEKQSVRKELKEIEQELKAKEQETTSPEIQADIIRAKTKEKNGKRYKEKETKSKGKRYKEPKHLDNTSKKSKKKSKGRSK